MSDKDNNRCAVCGWPLAAYAGKGCIRGSCSMRPLPSNIYDAERANKEYGKVIFKSEPAAPATPPEGDGPKCHTPFLAGNTGEGYRKIPRTCSACGAYPVASYEDHQKAQAEPPASGGEPPILTTTGHNAEFRIDGQCVSKEEFDARVRTSNAHPWATQPSSPRRAEELLGDTSPEKELVAARNKWHILCYHFSLPPYETSVTTISDRLEAAESRVRELEGQLEQVCGDVKAAQADYSNEHKLREKAEADLAVVNKNLAQKEEEYEKLCVSFYRMSDAKDAELTSLKDLFAELDNTGAIVCLTPRHEELRKQLL